MLTIVSMGPIHTLADLGETIKRARREQGWSQIALAERANVARGALQKIEAGRGTVNLPTVLKILRTLSLDLTVTSRAIPIRIPPASSAADVHAQ
jgi:transcriptional regulator with XRE-family HTH domain